VIFVSCAEVCLYRMSSDEEVLAVLIDALTLGMEVRRAREQSGGGGVRAPVVDAVDGGVGEVRPARRSAPVVVPGASRPPVEAWLVGSGRCYHVRTCGIVQAADRNGGKLQQTTVQEAVRLGKRVCGQVRCVQHFRDAGVL
jgi:hypothetical protein